MFSFENFVNESLQMDDFLRRLKSERKRLDLNQEDFGALGGVKKSTQSQYESGKRVPDIQYLLNLQANETDVFFLLTGTPSPERLSQEEKHLLAIYRSLDERERVMLVAGFSSALQAGVSVSGKVKNMSVIQGDVKKVHIGDKGDKKND